MTQTTNPVSPYLTLPLRSRAAAVLDTRTERYQTALVRMRVQLQAQKLSLLGRNPSTLERIVGRTA